MLEESKVSILGIIGTCAAMKEFDQLPKKGVPTGQLKAYSPMLIPFSAQHALLYRTGYAKLSALRKSTSHLPNHFWDKISKCEERALEAIAETKNPEPSSEIMKQMIAFYKLVKRAGWAMWTGRIDKRVIALVLRHADVMLKSDKFNHFLRTICTVHWVPCSWYPARQASLATLGASNWRWMPA